ncbi:hypothetical protein pb186bvf_002747 [Paramecium bursaria]
MEIKQLFCKEKYQQTTGIKLEIQKGNQDKISQTQKAILMCLDEHPPNPIQLVYCVKFIKDCIEQLNFQFISWVDIHVMPYYESIARNDQSRGKFYFSQNPTGEQQQYGQTLVILILECIEVWAQWFPLTNSKISQFQRSYDLLIHQGVQFPQHKYFKQDFVQNIKQQLIQQQQKVEQPVKQSLEERTQQLFQQYNLLKTQIITAFQTEDEEQLQVLNNKYLHLSQNSLFDELQGSDKPESADLAEKLLEYESYGTDYQQDFISFQKKQLTFNQFKNKYLELTPQGPPEENFQQFNQQVPFQSQTQNNAQVIKQSFKQQAQPEPPQQQSNAELIRLSTEFRLKEQDYKNKIAEQQHIITVLEVEQERLRQQLNNHQNQQHNIQQDSIEQMKEQIHILKQQLQERNENNHKQSQEINSLLSQKQELEVELNKNIHQVSVLQQNIYNLEQKSNSQQQQLNKHVNDKEQQSKDQKQQNELQKQLQELYTRIQDLQTEKIKTEIIIQQEIEKRQEFQLQNKLLEDKVKTLLKENKRFQEDQVNNNQFDDQVEINHLKLTITENQNLTNKLQEENRNLLIQNNKLNAELQKLVKPKAEFQNNQIQQFELNPKLFDHLFDLKRQNLQPKEDQGILNLIFPLSPAEYYQIKEKGYSQMKGVLIKVQVVPLQQPLIQDSMLLQEGLIYKNDILNVYYQTKFTNKGLSFLLLFQLINKGRAFNIKRFEFDGGENILLGWQNQQQINNQIVVEVGIPLPKEPIECKMILEDSEQGSYINFKLPICQLKLIKIIDSTTEILRKKWKDLNKSYKTQIIRSRYSSLEYLSYFPLFKSMLTPQKERNSLSQIGNNKIGFLSEMNNHQYLIRLLIKPNNDCVVQLKSDDLRVPNQLIEELVKFII